MKLSNSSTIKYLEPYLCSSCNKFEKYAKISICTLPNKWRACHWVFIATFFKTFNLQISVEVAFSMHIFFAIWLDVIPFAASIFLLAQRLFANFFKAPHSFYLDNHIIIPQKTWLLLTRNCKFIHKTHTIWWKIPIRM